MDNGSSLLVLGLGNLLCSDDGVGAAAAQAIAETRILPDGVRVLDGGTLGLALLPWLEDAERAILVDAIQADGPPGTLVRLEGDEVGPAVAARLSVHQVGVADLIEAARWRGRVPPKLVLVGVVPLTTELGVEFSAPVAAAFPGLLERVVDEARAMGFPLEPRDHHGEDAPAAAPRLPAAVGSGRHGVHPVV